MRPACIKCSKFLYPKKNGALVTIFTGNEPRSIRMGDIWACYGCELEIVSGWGREPLSCSGDADFTQVKQNCDNTQGGAIEVR